MKNIVIIEKKFKNLYRKLFTSNFDRKNILLDKQNFKKSIIARNM